MWLNSSDEQRPGKRSRGEGKGDEAGSVNKVLHNLDARVRNQEGKTATYFVSDQSPLAQALVKANEHYDAKKPAKGQPHELGPRRTTLAGAFLLALSQADLGAIGQEEKNMIGFFDTVAEKVGGPKIQDQQQLVISLVATYNTPKLLEPEIQTCMFFKTKKTNKYVFAIEFQPHSPLRHCYEFVRIGLMGAGATLADGSPPRGPLIRDIPRS